MSKKTRVNWFCKHCQVRGSFEIDATMFFIGKELIALINADHEKKDKIGGDTWTLLNIKDYDKVYPTEDMIKIGSSISTNEDIIPQFIVLHIQ